MLEYCKAVDKLERRVVHLTKMRLRGARGRYLYELYMGEIGFFHDREEDFEDVTLQMG